LRGLIARPTAQTAPGRRSIQITISCGPPSSARPCTTRSANRIASASRFTAEGYNRRVGWFSKFLRNPFASLFARSSREDQLAAYVIREHKLGRTLEDILDDPYLRNRASDVERRRLLERPDIIRAIGEDTASAAAGSSGS